MTRRTLTGASVLAALASLGQPGSAGAAEWVRVDTPNFVVFAESGPGKARQVAEEFERFREALSRVISAGAVSTPVPTVIVAFDTQRSFAPYRPLYNGKPVQLNGYVSLTDTHSIIGLALQNHDEALRIIFHEYAHLVVGNAAQGLPAWVSEGLAEYYSTFAIAADGRTATLGKVIPSHLLLLNERSLLKHEDLLQVDGASPLYNEGERRSLFYAQSWALVHMLISGEPSRTKELATYVELTSAGTAAVDAWRQVFGVADVNHLLERYVTHGRMHQYLFKFEGGIETTIGDGVPQSASDVHATFGDLLRHVVPESAETHLRRAAGMQPASARARALLGLVKLRAGDASVARALLLEAAADRGDWLVQYDVAAGLAELYSAAGRPEKDRADIRSALDVVLAARPNLAHAHLLKARVEGVSDAALTSVQRARLLAPGRQEYVLAEAEIRAGRDEYAAARHLVGSLMSPRVRPELREHARTFMRYIVQREQARAQQAALPDIGPAPPGPDTASAPESTSGQPEVIPVYREPAPGEQRIEGRLEQVECGRGRVVLHVRTADRVARFHAATLGDIDFITYRTDVWGTVSCGTRGAPEKVYVTWRTAEDRDGPASDGRVVAVEFAAH